MKKKKLLSVLAAAGLIAGFSLTAVADGGRADLIKSTGIAAFTDPAGGSVYIDSEDMRYLADELDYIEEQYINQMLPALEAVGVATDDLRFDTLAENLHESQTLAEGDTGAIADNLKLGTVVFVEGQEIIGNGADIDAAYKQGVMDGREAVVLTGNRAVRSEYIYHEHVLADGTVCTETVVGTDQMGGCFIEPVYHEHDVSCYGGEYNCENGITNDDPSMGSAAWVCKHDEPYEAHAFEGVTTLHTCTHISHLQCLQGGQHEGYTFGCGKTTETLESAVIYYK